MQPTGHLAWFLIVSCVMLCALFSIAFLFEDDGEADPILRPADGLTRSPTTEVSCELPAADDRFALVGPVNQTSVSCPALRAAVPGGLCLLI